MQRRPGRLEYVVCHVHLRPTFRPARIGSAGLASTEAPNGAKLGFKRRLNHTQDDVLQIFVGHTALLCEGRAQRAMFTSVCQY